MSQQSLSDETKELFKHKIGKESKPQVCEVAKIMIQRYVEALQAEGVDIDIPGSKPLHMLPLFQIENDGMYGFKKRIYKDGDFPVAEKYYNNLMSMPTFTLPSSKKIIDQYLKAFEKVGDNYEELL